jgi:hypothetical protein
MVNTDVAQKRLARRDVWRSTRLRARRYMAGTVAIENTAERLRAAAGDEPTADVHKWSNA